MQEIIQFVSKHLILSLIWIVLVGSLIFTIVRNHFSNINGISNDEAIHLINKESAMILDLRNCDDYYKGHIINSLNLAASDIQSGNLGELEKIKDKPIIIVYINHSTISRNSAKNLIKSGFKRVYVLKAGISGWSGENLPLFIGR